MSKTPTIFQLQKKYKSINIFAKPNSYQFSDELEMIKKALFVGFNKKINLEPKKTNYLGYGLSIYYFHHKSDNSFHIEISPENKEGFDFDFNFTEQILEHTIDNYSKEQSGECLTNHDLMFFKFLSSENNHLEIFKNALAMNVGETNGFYTKTYRQLTHVKPPEIPLAEINFTDTGIVYTRSKNNYLEIYIRDYGKNKL